MSVSQELSRWRNQLAHGGDAEISISETQLGEAIEFIGAFSVALDAACTATLKQLPSG